MEFPNNPNEKLLELLARGEDPNKKSKAEKQTEEYKKRYEEYKLLANRIFATEDGKKLATILLNESQFFMYDNNNEKAINYLSPKRDLVKFVLINAIEPALLASIMKE